MSSKQQKQQCDPKTTDCIEKEEMVKESLKKPIIQVVGSAGIQPAPMTHPSWRGGRKKRRRKSRKKKRKSRRKTRKKRRRKSRKKRKTRRRKKGGVKQSAFKKTLSRSKTVTGNLAGLALQSKPHARRITRTGFKAPKPSSLRKQFRPISPQSQPQLMQQPLQGLAAAQQPLAPLAQQPLAQQMEAMSINTPSPVSSGGEEITGFMNPQE